MSPFRARTATLVSCGALLTTIPVTTGGLVITAAGNGVEAVIGGVKQRTGVDIAGKYTTATHREKFVTIAEGIRWSYHHSFACPANAL